LDSLGQAHFDDVHRGWFPLGDSDNTVLFFDFLAFFPPVHPQQPANGA